MELIVYGIIGGLVGSLIVFTTVNYPTTKDGWASGITDSPIGLYILIF